jgi:hypothetical protein
MYARPYICTCYPCLSLVCALQAWTERMNTSPGWWPVTDLRGYDGDSDDETVAESKKKVNSTLRAWKALLEEEQREAERIARDLKTRKALAEAARKH